jgi:hypothetical protein
MRFSPDLRVRYDGPAWVARRRALHYTVRPPGSEDARVELILDAATYYPLRLERYGARGQLVSSTICRKVDFAAAPPQRLPVPSVAAPEGGGPRTPRATAATEQQLAKLLGGRLLKPDYLPPGVHLRGMFIHVLAQRQVAEIRYFDGLRMLSVMQLQRPRNSAPHGAKAAQRGANPARLAQGAGRWAFWRRAGQKAAADGKPAERPTAHGQGGVRPSMLRGSVVRERRGDRVIIVAGEVAADELQKVMSSIPYPPAQRPVKF